MGPLHLRTVSVAVGLLLCLAGCAGRTITASALDQVLIAGPPPAAEAPAAPPAPLAKGSVPPPTGEPREQPTAAEEGPLRAAAEEGPPPVAAQPAPLAEVPVVPEEIRPAAPVPPAAIQEAGRGPEPAPAPEQEAPSVPSRPGEAPQALPSLSLADAYFDYDRFALRDDARAALEEDARQLKANDGWTLLVEGHCDERGTSAYNLVLGERRAMAARQYLADLGLPPARIQTTSFGKERPFCLDHSEPCWQRNRRAHLFKQEAGGPGVDAAPGDVPRGEGRREH